MKFVIDFVLEFVLEVALKFVLGVCPGVCSGVCDGDPWSCISICVFFHKDSTTIVAQRGVRLFVEYSETFLSMSVKRKQK